MAPDNGGFLLEYPLIRVDNFTSTLPSLPEHLDQLARHDLPAGATHYVHPHILLLSHPHTDHLNGLSSIARHSAPIYCSQVTKDLLLALERKEDRIRFDQGKTPTRRRPYKHLRRTVEECRTLDRQTGMHTGSAYDILVALPFDKPVLLRYNATVQIRITLLPANHMPGSTMFYVEGPRGSVLHTGDLRCETTFIHSLLATTHLGRIGNARTPTLMISPTAHTPNADDRAQVIMQSCPSTPSATGASRVDVRISPRLVTLYLDTERMSDSGEPPGRAEAILDTIQAMKLFPASTRFHVDCWTSGYEHFLISSYKAFGDGYIHIDRYKSDLYTLMAQDDEFCELASICSRDVTKCGRICACDEELCKSQCVLIVPRESMSKEDWRHEKGELASMIRAARQGRSPYPNSVSVPIQRHSPLPELYRMVELLRPEHVVANTASPSARFLCARMTETLSLVGAPDADRRHSVPPNRRRERNEDEEVWQRITALWHSSTSSEADSKNTNVAEKFFAHVARFRKALWGVKKIDSERLLTERLDAACDALDAKDMLPDASACVFQARSEGNAAQPWKAAGQYASSNASPFMTAAMRAAGVNALPTWPAPSGASPNRPIAMAEDSSAKAYLSTELASRYLAYAAMYLGWKIRNPSRYRQDVAWRAIRKLKPALAHETEKALERELGWAVPPWDGDRMVNATVYDSESPTSPCERAAADQAVEMTLIERAATPASPLVRQVGMQMAVQQSISPLQLDRAELEKRLADEAESQRLGFSDEDGEEKEELDDLKNISDSQTPSITDDELAETVRCLRRGHTVPRSVQGPLAFLRIAQEWEARSRRTVTCPSASAARLHDQLNIVGVAAYSRRGREMLNWRRADFKRALQALHSLSLESRKSIGVNKSLPARHRVVLRYLRHATTLASSPGRLSC